ncbi:Glycerol-3-phosphate dehydrogenase, mitochondrial [Neolecta irregularis DAH-3]|uniref:glycerol-3-phosphate dehydrogenase n=1 Tax=Neolecta irregularis (strain DAH-3) TaxID=1198029 RepID=A0A1U7LHW8_NEOID|nr:Glycerol-3-phosphate dehydrogenase, mitochondrial [Neolecta irregularis DAH-3]|eukprot:OLL22121.1 Glycerol-3-phosphate dehydrogenase, mitochondrial [Neolecta irregularis DAH-3]
MFRHFWKRPFTFTALGATTAVCITTALPTQKIHAEHDSHSFPDATLFPHMPPRSRHLESLRTEKFDLLVVGAGATGSGTALDAASRGLKVALVERDDFAAGTSSRSTKLVHGGVRYLEKAFLELDYEQYKLVKEALRERATFLHIAPHLSHALPIMIPIYKIWQGPYYWAGTKVYDMLAGKDNMESSYFLTRGKALEAFPMLKPDKLVGALVYYDGSHNDSRMCTSIALTAVLQGATVANHVEVVSLQKIQGKICGATVRDNLSGKEWDVAAKAIINATGPFTDSLRKLDDPLIEEIVAPSSGVHVVLPGYYSPEKMGLIDPKTSDGRVIFFLPWQGNCIAGTTDAKTPVLAHPLPKEEEINWILSEIKRYLNPDINVRRGDVLAAWAGIRPLVRDPAAKNTQSLVRNHMINVSPSGLITIAGGKWTTYRQMAEDVVDEAIRQFKLTTRTKCRTEQLKLIGADHFRPTLFIKLIQQFGFETEVAKHLVDSYGDRAWSVAAIAEETGQRWPVRGKRLSSFYPFIEGEIRYAVRNEYAQTAVDVLARRTRLAFLSSQAALDALPRVIDILSEELSWSFKRKQKEWDDTVKYLLTMGLPASKQHLSRTDVESGRSARFDSKEDYRLYSRHDGPEGLDE